MDDFSMDWDQEIQDMVDDLLLDALVLELCRLATPWFWSCADWRRLGPPPPSHAFPGNACPN